MQYHEPEDWALYQKGITEDFESSTGLFIDANSQEEAIDWAEIVAEALLRKSNNDETLNWKDLGYRCHIMQTPERSAWNHCLSFFQRVHVGEWPDLSAMGTAAYSKWAEENGIKYT
jgi:hypothetical protein